MTENINWSVLARNLNPDIRVLEMNEVTRGALDQLSRLHSPEKVLNTLTSHPNTTGGTSKFPFIRPVTTIIVGMGEAIDLIEKPYDSPGMQNIRERVNTKGPVIRDLLVTTDCFYGMIDPNPLGDFAWFTRPEHGEGENILPQIRGALDKLTNYLETQR